MLDDLMNRAFLMVGFGSDDSFSGWLTITAALIVSWLETMLSVNQLMADASRKFPKLVLKPVGVGR